MNGSFLTECEVSQRTRISVATLRRWRLERRGPSLEEVRRAAKRARDLGATGLCMGAAWRSVPAGKEFERVLDMVRAVKGFRLEACATLGMLNTVQAQQLKEAGLDAYNHKLDTSYSFYEQIITTRSYEDRLRTLQAVREAGITVCCGGILGLGESESDRCQLLATLASMQPPSEPVPINLLVPVQGTPLESAQPIKTTELIRVIATARILMPKSRVRLSAGRLSISNEGQLLAFYAGANSIFIGDKLLTTPNISEDDDRRILAEVSV